MASPFQASEKSTTGIDGLDEILYGGLPSHNIYLLQGEAGTGKTTLALQFSQEGLRRGERVLYVALSESAAELRDIARSHGWSLDGIHIHELTAAQAAEWMAADQTVFPTSEVELGEVTDEILHVIAQVQPDRMVFDSVSEIRLMADTPIRYRRQILGLRHILSEQKVTSLFLDIGDLERHGTNLDSLVHGVIRMEQVPLDYGTVRRRLRINKMRGMAFHEGYHDYRIRTGGLEIFPRTVIPAERSGKHRLIASGIAELDALLGGGLASGTACLITGQTGTGKTSTALRFAHEVARTGGRAVLYLFDERVDTLYRRSAGIGMDVRPLIDAGNMAVHQINTGEISPGEFAQMVRRSVDDFGAEVVVIDSINGYLNAMPQERLLLNQMHDLLSFLAHRSVLSVLTLTQHGILMTSGKQSVDLSYLADTVLLMRHFEAAGVLRLAISVVKKRDGTHEKTIREMKVTENGLQVGEVLNEFTGILTGNPIFTGNARLLLGGADSGGDPEADGTH